MPVRDMSVSLPDLRKPFTRANISPTHSNSSTETLDLGPIPEFRLKYGIAVFDTSSEDDLEDETRGYTREKKWGGRKDIKLDRDKESEVDPTGSLTIQCPDYPNSVEMDTDCPSPVGDVDSMAEEVVQELLSYSTIMADTPESDRKRRSTMRDSSPDSSGSVEINVGCTVAESLTWRPATVKREPDEALEESFHSVSNSTPTEPTEMFHTPGRFPDPPEASPEPSSSPGPSSSENRTSPGLGSSPGPSSSENRTSPGPSSSENRTSPGPGRDRTGVMDIYESMLELQQELTWVSGDDPATPSESVIEVTEDIRNRFLPESHGHGYTDSMYVNPGDAVPTVRELDLTMENYVLNNILAKRGHQPGRRDRPMGDEPGEVPGDSRQEGADDELNMTLELRSDSSSESIDVGEEVETATKSRGLLNRSREDLLTMPPVAHLSGRKRPARPRSSPPRKIRRQDIGRRPPLRNYMHQQATSEKHRRELANAEEAYWRETVSENRCREMLRADAGGHWRDLDVFGVFSGKRKTDPASVETEDSERFDFSLWQRSQEKKLQEGFEGQEGPVVPELEVEGHTKKWRCSNTTLSPVEGPGESQQRDQSSCVVQ